MRTATNHLNLLTITREPTNAIKLNTRGERVMHRTEFDPALATRERALGVKLIDRATERRN